MRRGEQLALEEFRRGMLALLGEIRRRELARARDEGKLLLPLDTAARLLGCDPKTTLRTMIARGELRTVQGPRGWLVPRTELARIALEGFPPSVVPARARRQAIQPGKRASRAAPAKSLADEIRAIRI